MTREEVIVVIKAYRDKLTHSVSNQLDGDIEAYNMAIEALEQKPTDAISRQAVLDYIDKMPSELTTDGRRMIRRRTLEEYVSDTLPSINPQEKTGHWIIYPKDIYAHLICDTCLSNAPYDCKTNYCPKCGAKMIESEEI